MIGLRQQLAWLAPSFVTHLLLSACATLQVGQIWLELGAGQTVMVVLDCKQAIADTQQVLAEYEISHPVSKDLIDCMPSSGSSSKSRTRGKGLRS